MTALSPLARIVDCLTNDVLATSVNLLDWSFSKDLDQLSQRSLVVPAADPGDADSGGAPSGFAAALLLASSDVLATAPRPLLCELSLDGGTAVDSRWLVRNPQRTLLSSRRTITDAGTDLADVLSAAVIERATYTDVSLADALSGNPTHLSGGTIVPLVPSGLMNVSEAIPYLAGILCVPWSAQPGLELWASGAAPRLAITAILSPDITGTATNVDINAATVMAALQTIVNRLAGAASSQDYGHVVLDTSSSALNLSSSTDFSPAPTATGMSCVIGHKGTTAHVIFDASGNADVDETTHARVHLDQSSVHTDDQITPAANFIGGKSKAGLPQDAAITALAIINGSAPAISGSREDWPDCLPLLGVDVKGETGGVYATILDGQAFPLPGSPAVPVHSLAMDTGSLAAPRNATLYAGSLHGVYYASAPAGGLTLYPAALDWRRLDGLDGDVVRLQVQVDPGDQAHNVLFALVSGSGDRWDGLWIYKASTGWQRHLQSTKVRDVVTTDYQTAWVIDEAGDAVFRYHLGDDSPTPPGGYAVPSGQAYALGRAITVAHDALQAQDSVWAFVDGGGTSGHYTPAHYLCRTDPGTTWTWHDANQDNTLAGSGAQGAPLHAYCVTGAGVSIDQSFGGPLPAAFVGTDQGALWTAGPLGGALAWQRADQGGLSNFAIRRLGMGEAQTVLGKAINRIYAATDNDLLYSCDSGRYWEQLAGRERTSMGPHLSAVTLSINNANGSGTGYTLPSNRIRTWGTTNADSTAMTASPLGLAANTHVHVPSGHPDALPAGYYLERYHCARLDFEYRMRRQDAHLPGQQMSQLPEVQTNAAVQANDASAGVITVARRWMQQQGVPHTQITIQSSFSTTESALRTLRPTHLCRLVGQIAITDLSSAGEAVTTHVLSFDGSESLYCIAHTVKRGPGRTAMTQTVLSPRLLAVPLSESDLAGALTDSIAAVRVWGAR